jgi:ribonuclease P protein component
MLAVRRVASVWPYKGDAVVTRDVPSRQGRGVCADSTVDTVAATVSATAWNEKAVREGSQGFPRTARLLKADEFATLFRMRPLKRSEHFVVYARPRALPVALSPALADGTAESSVAASGNVTGEIAAGPVVKVSEPASTFSADAILPAPSVLPGRMGLVLGKKFAARLRAAKFAGWDVLIRLNLRFDKKRFPGAASPSLKRVCRSEIVALLDEAARQIARAGGAGATPQALQRAPRVPTSGRAEKAAGVGRTAATVPMPSAVPPKTAP